MIKRIELINFMSHKHTVIEPSAGLTVLVGPNNCGKSAIVTALQILCHNDNSTYVLRHGAKECQIIVETDAGHRIQWSRKKSGSPSYKIDGKEFDRIRGESGVWDELKRTLKLPRVEFDNSKFDVHIGEQRNPVFLLGDKGKGAAQFFASSSDAIKLVEMQDLHKSNVRENKKEHTRLKNQQTQVAQALESLDPIGAVNEELSEVEKQFAELNAEKLAIDRLESVQSDLAKKQTDAKRFAAIKTVIGTLSEPPQFEDPEPLQLRVAELCGLQNTIQKSSRFQEAFQSLAEPPALADPEPLQNRVAQLRMLNDSICKSSRCHEVFQSLAEPPLLADATSLQNHLSALRLQQRLVSRLAKLQSALASIPQPPKPTDAESVSSLAKSVVNLQIAHESVEQMKKDLASVAKKVSKSKSAIQDWAADNPSCPTCGSEVNAETILSGGGHQHG